MNKKQTFPEYSADPTCVAPSAIEPRPRGFLRSIPNHLIPPIIVSWFLSSSSLLVASTPGLVLSENDSLIPPDQVTAEAVRNDIEFLLTFFKRGYGGYKAHPTNLIHSAEREFETIASVRSQMTPKAFCQKIAAGFELLQDAHLEASLPGFKCGTDSQRTGQIGKNVAPFLGPTNKRPWKILRVRVDGLDISVLGITKFPPANDSSWQGFREAYKRLAKQPVIIIDLRGNQGGDDTRGFELAKFLYGGPPPFRAEQRIMRRTPEAIALRLNRLLLMKRNAKETSPAMDESISEFQNLYRQAIAGSISDEVVDHLDHKRMGRQTKAYQGQIYILADADCGSSGETTLDALRSHPKAKFVGENTAGFLHYGNVGKIVLPNSKVQIQMGTQFIRYRDNQIFERVGFAPDLAVPPGNDALVWAIRDYKQHL